MSYYVIIGQMVADGYEADPHQNHVWCARVFHTEPSATQHLAHLKTATERLFQTYLNSQESGLDSIKAFYRGLVIHDSVGARKLSRENLDQPPTIPDKITYSICVSPHG